MFKPFDGKLSMNKSKIFEKLNGAIENHKQINNKPCPDEKRYYICFKEDKFIISKKSSRKGDLPKLIFILESPHKREFNNEGKPLGPAKGRTGCKFDNALCNFLVLAQHHYDCFVHGEYEVWLVNAVQYQVSLGAKPKEYRSILFQVIWHSFGKKDFEKRLKKLLTPANQGSVIFNACTKGSEINTPNAKDLIKTMNLQQNDTLLKELKTTSENIDLNQLVQKSIESLSEKSFKASHPSQWDPMFPIPNES